MRDLNRFKDGNIRVVEDYTTSTLTVSDVVLTVNGEQLADVECVGEAVDGFLFFAAPASYVVRGGFLVHDDCDTQNMEGLALFGTMDALSLFEYADTADSSAISGDLDLTAGPFSGEINYNDGVGPAGTVSATVSAVRNGRVIRNCGTLRRLLRALGDDAVHHRHRRGDARAATPRPPARSTTSMPRGTKTGKLDG